MRNIVSALLAVVVATYYLLLSRIIIINPNAGPLGLFEVLTNGSKEIYSVIVREGLVGVLAVFPIWLLMGVVIGLAARFGWNTVRSSCWIGLSLGVFTLSAMLNPEFWSAPDRNFQIFYVFVVHVLAAQVTLVSALPMAFIKARLMVQKAAPLPVKIETTCECGAVFKSRPLICSECGRILRQGNESSSNVHD